MKMTELKLNIPQDILYTLNETKNDFVKKMRLYAAMELYRMQKLSMGKASELAEMNKTNFMFELGKYEIPAINYDPDDFRNENEITYRFENRFILSDYVAKRQEYSTVCLSFRALSDRRLNSQKQGTYLILVP
jgi:predicted HTH domain antitoxin